MRLRNNHILLFFLIFNWIVLNANNKASSILISENLEYVILSDYKCFANVIKEIIDTNNKMTNLLVMSEEDDSLYYCRLHIIDSNIHTSDLINNIRKYARIYKAGKNIIYIISKMDISFTIPKLYYNVTGSNGSFYFRKSRFNSCKIYDYTKKLIPEYSDMSSP
jgi:hypothetical protein